LLHLFGRVIGVLRLQRLLNPTSRVRAGIFRAVVLAEGAVVPNNSTHSSCPEACSHAPFVAHSSPPNALQKPWGDVCANLVGFFVVS
jgi:hypothetical protein